jgi:Toprim domain/DNA primase catalytic core, N-terminal domain
VSTASPSTPAKLPSANGRARRKLTLGRRKARFINLDDFLDDTLYPALFERLNTAFPEFGFVRRGDSWVATIFPGNFPYPVEHKNPDRLVVYRNSPHWIKIHGHSGLRWLDYVNGGHRPLGAAFLNGVKKLCALAGVDFPIRTKEKTKQEVLEATRKDARCRMLEEYICLCEEELWKDTAKSKAAREYLRSRGFSEEDIRAFRFGLAPHNYAVGAHLAKLGFSNDAIREVCFPKMVGFITIPWLDAYGYPLTVYGRWPAKNPPEMKKFGAWRKSHAELKAAWEKSGKSIPWVEPRIPKTIALPGENTKATPFCFDRTRQAGHREIVVVEGVFDALFLQLRGETRCVASVAAQLDGNQLSTLVRHRIERVYICGDPDGGGDRGALANIRNLTAIGIVSYVVSRLPEGVDPDEFVQANGIDAFKNLVSASDHSFRFIACHLLALHRPEGVWNDPSKDSVLRAAREFVATIPKELQADIPLHFWPVVAEELEFDVQALTATGETPPASDGSTAGTQEAAPSSSSSEDDEDEKLHLTDLGNAKRLVARSKKLIRYCFPWKKWLVWVGQNWRMDDTGQADRLAKDTIAALFHKAASEVAELRDCLKSSGGHGGE